MKAENRTDGEREREQREQRERERERGIALNSDERRTRKDLRDDLTRSK